MFKCINYVSGKKKSKTEWQYILLPNTLIPVLLFSLLMYCFCISDFNDLNDDEEF